MSIFQTGPSGIQSSDSDQEIDRDGTTRDVHDFQSDIDAVGRIAFLPTLLETVLLATGMGFAAVARVTEDRWITCRALDKISFGLTPGDELVVETTICHEIRQSGVEVVIDDVPEDPRFSNHHTPRQYGFRSYISIPVILADGTFFGTFCAIDPEPCQLSDPRVLGMFRLFAKMIGEALDADTKLRASEVTARNERRLIDKQERFIAILAHDLRNPISALGAGLRMMERRGLDTQNQELVTLMRASVQRMAGLVANLLDQARSRQSDGIVVERDAAERLDPTLFQIIAELQAVAPDQKIEVDIDLPAAINCDRARVAQMLSNLLGNAITHGAPGAPIHVRAAVEAGEFTLAVTNHGARIPDALLPGLFKPFTQSETRSSREGLGLGLYIAYEIARAHGGDLGVTTDDAATVFTFRMPHR